MPTNIKEHNAIFVEFTNFFLGGKEKRDEIEEERLAQPEGPVTCIVCQGCLCLACAPCTHCADEPQSTNASVITQGLHDDLSSTVASSQQQPDHCSCGCGGDECGDCGGDESAYVSAYDEAVSAAFGMEIAAGYMP